MIYVNYGSLLDIVGYADKSIVWSSDTSDSILYTQKVYKMMVLLFIQMYDCQKIRGNN